MYGRIKRRGRPPKTPNTERPKFQVHLLKKPQYLKNLEPRGLNSPITSRGSSPMDTDSSRKGSAKKGGKRKSNVSTTKGRGATAANQRRKQSLETDYHYGSDFEDSTDHDDELGLSESETELEKDDPLDDMSDSDISLSSFSTASGTNKNKFCYISRMSPEPFWLQTEKEIQPLELPRSSDDLLIPREHIMQTLSIYEVLRHFRSLIRLSPFRFEDFCAVLNFEEQSNLLVEIHVSLLKTIFREEDTQQTHFGPLDQKDSANSVLYFIDPMTWPEALRSYIESDKTFDQEVLNILNTCEYPFTDIEKRLKVLQFLTDQILITSPVREDLIHEGGFQYDDHCRVCHRVGELLCCETCPAVFHLECVDPPLRDVPQEDWQCNLCKAHKVTGLSDCLPDVEKSGLLCRQEHLGFDRAGRKYWFLSRRIFVESASGECLYYSTPVQFEELLSCLDEKEYEAPLCRELNDFKDEIVRQMELTEKLTNQQKQGKKTFFEVENAALLKERKEREELRQKLAEEEEREKERLEAEERERQTKEEERAKAEEEREKKNQETKTEENSSQDTKEKVKEEDEDMEVDENGDKKQRVTRSKTGSLTPRTFNMDDLRRRSDRINHQKSSGLGDTEAAGEAATRVTRYKANQIAHHGSFLFKLGMEAGFKNYVNQFSVNQIALNKTQRNEERDKKRHMSHKFSLTPSGEFKWSGPVHGPRNMLVNTLRATLLQLESSIIPAFMHVNWPSLRKAWVSTVNNSVKARDFTRAMIVLQACIKPVVYASVWHEQLGHIRLHRLTALEREEKKRLEKKEKKEKDDEEEKNRMTNSWVKYTLGLKHQVWKQKGEEYRIHGQWGWQWLSATRNFKALDCRTVGLRAGAIKYMVQVKDDFGLKILGVEPHIYKYFMRKNSVTEDEPLPEDKENDDQLKDILTKQPELQKLRILPPVSEFEEIDISKALLTTGRIQYPKVARKSKLDDLLARRMHLKLVEERTLAQKALISSQASRAELKSAEEISKEITTNRVLMTAISRKISLIKQQFTELSRSHQQYKCYSRECRAISSRSNSYITSCYSYECRKRAKLGRELYALFSKADVLRKSFNSNSGSSTQPQQNPADHKYSTLRNVLESKTSPTASPGKLPWQQNSNATTSQPANGNVTTTSNQSTNDLKPDVSLLTPAPQGDKTNTSPMSGAADDTSESLPSSPAVKQEAIPSLPTSTSVEAKPDECTKNVANATTTHVDEVKPMDLDGPEDTKEGVHSTQRDTKVEPSETARKFRLVGFDKLNTEIKSSPMDVDVSSASSSSASLDTKTETLTTPVSMIKDEELTCDSVDSGSNSASGVGGGNRKFQHLEVDLESSSQSSSNEEFRPKSPATAESDVKTEVKLEDKTSDDVDVENVSMEDKPDTAATSSETKIKTEEPLDTKVKLEDSTKQEPADESTNVDKKETVIVTKTTTVTTTTTSSETVKLVDGVVTKVEVTQANCLTTATSTCVSSGGKASKTESTVLSVVDAEKKSQERNRAVVTRRATSLSCVQTVEEKDEDPDRVYSSTNTRKKVYLKRVNMLGTAVLTSAGADKRRKRPQVKYPHCSTFHTRSKKRNLLVLPQHELRKLARCAARHSVQGFAHQAKCNPVVWSYPCSRPTFHTCWLYRTITFKTLQAAALQTRILWACLRWEDMGARVQNNDGKHQTTSDSEIVTTELLKQRHTGQFLEVTQYLMRKVVIPLEVPKQVREVPNPIRSGLRKRKREETPVITEPQVSEEWVDESKLELWEIKQFWERMERQAQMPRLRSSATGTPGSVKSENKAPVADEKGAATAATTPAENRNRTVGEETKEKLENTIRHQRALLQQQSGNGKQQSVSNGKQLVPVTKIIQHHANSALPLNNKTNVNAAAFTKTTNNNSQQPAVIKIVQKTIPSSGGTPQQKQVTINKTTLSSILSSNNDTPRRIIMTKGSDGKPRIISASPSTITPASSISTSSSPSTIITCAASSTQIAPSPVVNAQAPTQAPQQRVQLHRAPGGKLIVKGLMPGQQIVQMPDGKLHVFSSPVKTQALPQQQQQQIAPSPLATTAPLAGVTTTPGSQQRFLARGPSTPTTGLGVPVVRTISVANRQVTPITVKQVTPQQQRSLTPLKLAPHQQTVVTTNKQGQTVVIRPKMNNSSQQPQQIMIGGNQVVTSQQVLVNASGQQILTTANQVGAGNNLVQQIALQGGGKATLATINGQQVLIRTAPAPNSAPTQVSLANNSTGTSIVTPSGQTLKVVRSSNLTTGGTLQPGQQVVQLNNSQAVQLSNQVSQQVVQSNSAGTGGLSNNLVTSDATHNNNNNSPHQTYAVKTQKLLQANDGSQPPPLSVQTQHMNSNTCQGPLTPSQQPQPLHHSTPNKAAPAVQSQTHSPVSGLTREQEAHLLRGQPPGTIIKCITAQVIQSGEGPRIVLQGIQGSDFTASQLAAVQTQVKQQLLKAQASSGNQGVLGPTRIYLAVQPSTKASRPPLPSPIKNAGPPPPVYRAPQETPSVIRQVVSNATSVQQPTQPRSQQVSIQQPPQSPAVSVQQHDYHAQPPSGEAPHPVTPVTQKPSSTSFTIVEAQGTQPRLGQPATTTQLIASGAAVTGNTGTGAGDNNKFVLSSEYISQTIRKALKQDNLNPDLEEKLLTQLKYHEKILKENGGGTAGTSITELDESPAAPVYTRPPPPGYTTAAARKRVVSEHVPAETGGVSVAKKSRVQHQHPTSTVDSEETHATPQKSAHARASSGKKSEEKRRAQEQRLTAKLLNTLNKHKELLKKDMLRKRSLLEKDLLFCIQRDIAKELSSLRHAPSTHEESEIQRAPSTTTSLPSSQALPHPTGSSKRKSAATPTTTIQPTPTRGRGRGRGRGSSHRTQQDATSRTSSQHHQHRGLSPLPDTVPAPQDSPSPIPPPRSSSANKKEKLLCMCRTPYDETKFYVGCDLCNNWFHGDCVGITEEMSKTLTEFVCVDCKRARETQELFCLCKQPYDESQFYICCDTCQDWFHGRCVGILQSEADTIDEYICPNCNSSESSLLANMKNLTPRDFDSLRKLMKQIQAHKSAWPFMDPVDPHEAPDYYNVVKEPMDLKTIELRIAQQRYKKLSDFIGDMTKIFDNCRYYNPRESPFFKHAHQLETFFVQKVKTLREKLVELK